MVSTFQGKHADAEPLYERSQLIREMVLGPEHRLVAEVLHHRAAVCVDQVGTEYQSCFWVQIC